MRRQFERSSSARYRRQKCLLEFEEQLHGYIYSDATCWELSFEVWAAHGSQDDLKALFVERLQDLYIETRPVVSLLGEGSISSVVGTASGFDVVHCTREMVEDVLERGLIPLKIDLDLCPDPEEARLQAREYLLLGEYALAVRYFEIALRGDSEIADRGQLLLSAGLACRLSGKVARARELLEEVEQFTDSPAICADSLQHLAAIEHDEGNHQVALAQALRALDYEPESGTKLFNVANAYCLLGCYQEALVYLSKALRSHSKDSIIEHVLKDGDFNGLRGTSGFKRILEDLFV